MGGKCLKGPDVLRGECPGGGGRCPTGANVCGQMSGGRCPKGQMSWGKSWGGGGRCPWGKCSDTKNDSYSKEPKFRQVNSKLYHIRYSL